MSPERSSAALQVLHTRTGSRTISGKNAYQLRTIWPSGRTAAQMPACAAAPGIPHTRWSPHAAENVAAGGGHILAAAHAVRAIPVRITAITPPCQTPDCRLEQGVDRRLAEIDLRTIIPARSPHLRRARHAHVLAPVRRKSGRLHRLALDSLVRPGAAGARQMLGQDGRERRRHVLGDQRESGRSPGPIPATSTISAAARRWTRSDRQHPRRVALSGRRNSGACATGGATAVSGRGVAPAAGTSGGLAGAASSRAGGRRGWRIFWTSRAGTSRRGDLTRTFGLRDVVRAPSASA